MEVNRIRELLGEGLKRDGNNVLDENLLGDIKNYAKNLAKKIFNRGGGDENQIASEIEDDIISDLPSNADANSDLEDVLSDETGDSNIEWPKSDEPKVEPGVNVEKPGIEEPVEPTPRPKVKPDVTPDNNNNNNNNIQVSEEVINKIIDGNYRVRMLYQGPKESKPHWRFIDIYAIGTSKAGNRVIRGYQAFGHTETAIPKWKLFRIDRILQLQITKYHYGKKAMDLYNHHGDGSMISMSKNKRF